MPGHSNGFRFPDAGLGKVGHAAQRKLCGIPLAIVRKQRKDLVVRDAMVNQDRALAWLGRIQWPVELVASRALCGVFGVSPMHKLQ